MASEIKLPELGENLESGEVLEVKVSPGDMVREGQTLLEIDAEKSTVEVPSPLAGRITQLLVKKGDQVRVDQAICQIETGDGRKNGEPSAGPVREEPKAAKAESPKPVSLKAPTASVPNEKPATDSQPIANEGRKSQPSNDPTPSRPEIIEPDSPKTTNLVPAGPATRRLAREFGVDLRLVPGSAPGGRVTPQDVKDFVRQMAKGIQDGRPTPMVAPPLPDFERWGPVERRPLEPVRRRTAEQTSLAWSQIPHVTQHDEADITDLDGFRRQETGQGPKLTITAFVLKATAMALKQFQQFNSTFDMGSGQLIIKRYYHIGVAVDTERGLLVPVIRDVDKKSVHDLAAELTEVAERARNKKTSLEEMRGGTFTVTNLGGIGGSGFTPIVNYPEVAILGLARSKLQPVVHNGQVLPRLILPLSLSYDHRVIDGANAARFTRLISEMLENPLKMLVYA